MYGKPCVCMCDVNIMKMKHIVMTKFTLTVVSTEVSNWQAVTQNLRMGLLSDIFRISDFFWKLEGGIMIEQETICSAQYSN